MKKLFAIFLCFTFITSAYITNASSMDTKELDKEGLLELRKEQVKFCDRILASLRYIFYRNNFRAVNDERTAFRSGEFYSVKTLAICLEKNKIDTIVNLRREQPDTWWHKLLQSAITTAKKKNDLDITLVDLDFNSHRAPNPEELEKFANLVASNKILLFIDKDGVNRTGLASATYHILKSDTLDKENIFEKIDQAFGPKKHRCCLHPLRLLEFIEYYFGWRPLMKFAKEFGGCYVDLKNQIQGDQNIDLHELDTITSDQFDQEEIEHLSYLESTLAILKIMSPWHKNADL